MTQKTIGPSQFYRLADIVAELSKRKDADTLSKIEADLAERRASVEETLEDLAQSVNDLNQEHRMNSRRQRPLESDQADPGEEYRLSSGDASFLRTAFDLFMMVRDSYQIVGEVVDLIRPAVLVLPKEGNREDWSLDGIQRMHFVMQLNAGEIDRFVRASLMISEGRSQIRDRVARASARLEDYHRVLTHRHEIEGIKVHGDAVITDVAMHIYENIDSHGEIAAGREAGEVSAYSVRKARLLAEAVRGPFVSRLLDRPGNLVDFLSQAFREVWEMAERLQGSVGRELDRIRTELGYQPHHKNASKADVERIIQSFRDADPQAVGHKEKVGMLTPDERFNLRFRNETLQQVTALLRQHADPQRIVDYVLERKATLRRYFHEENSFYVCSIGAGNPFLGEAPGALKVQPSPKPRASFDSIRGSGFSDLREFVQSVKSSAKNHNLFVATSPSGTADKSNVLLIGPQGCGKSEAMRALASEKDSIAIFAVGSDFLTCWKGEAQKNPKRLFEAAVKLQRESKRQIHILIDEIDAVLKRKEFVAHGDEDLTTEFQNLMDGVVSYPHISVWGATNHPERLPMPIIRRFNKVLIVGELATSDRVALLQAFTSTLPVDGFDDGTWRRLADQLDGATGDVVRKVADYVWRSKMSWFTSHEPKAAEELGKWLVRGGHFELEEFRGEERETFKRKLAEWVRVLPRDVEASIEMHLKNVAVSQEIRTAKDSYEKARAFVSDLNSSTIQIVAG